MMQPDEATCLLCEQRAVDGVRIVGFDICAACEERLLQCAPGDPNYDEKIERLKPLGVTALWAVATPPAPKAYYPS